MEINRIKAKVDDVLVKQELVELRNWVVKEAMTGRGGARQAWRGEKVMTFDFSDENRMLEY